MNDLRRVEYVSTALDPEYATDPKLEKLAARLSAEMTEWQMEHLRSVGMDEIADTMRDRGGVMPTARGLRDLLRREQRPREERYRDGHREQIRQKDAAWRSDHKEEFDERRLSRPFVVIDSEGQDYEGDDETVKTEYGDVLYKEHGTYLWCASTDDPDKSTHILRA